jgi:GIY-YIG catalytic domain
MKYVYILESLDSEHYYIGITDDLRARLASTTLAKCLTRQSIGLGGSVTKHRLSHPKNT